MLGAQLPWLGHHLYIFQEWPGGRWKPILETTANFHPTPGCLFLFECTLDCDYYLTFSIGQIMIELRVRNTLEVGIYGRILKNPCPQGAINLADVSDSM